MDESKFDIILDASDKDFAADLMKALGVKPGETVNFVSPQFTRTDGRLVSYLPNTLEEYAALPKMNPENLKKIGCQKWDKVPGGVHWLYPAEWYEHIPSGTEIVGINGVTEKFEPGVTDDDRRFGALSYGFIQMSH